MGEAELSPHQNKTGGQEHQMGVLIQTAGGEASVGTLEIWFGLQTTFKCLVLVSDFEAFFPTWSWTGRTWKWFEAAK